MPSSKRGTDSDYALSVRVVLRVSAAIVPIVILVAAIRATGVMDLDEAGTQAGYTLFAGADGLLAFEGEGEPVEYAVRMRRLPEEAMLAKRLAAGDVREEEMTALAHEELRHFRQVHDRILRRGGSLGSPRPDRYVRLLRRRCFEYPGGLGPEVDLLLVNAIIEARSCERMRLLADHLERETGELTGPERTDLLEFYLGLAAAEARHWERFRDLAERCVNFFAQ